MEKMCSPGCIKDWRINIMTEKKNNFEGEEFLEEVLQKLNIRLREIEKDLAEGQKDIESMHEYYWENYAEMDQYGYEDYDNRQALLQQSNANDEKQKL